jgi:hypothetical protein
MRFKLTVTCLLLLILTGGVHARNSFEYHVYPTYIDVIDYIDQVGLYGPITKGITQWASVSQSHGNGLNRPYSYCIPGIRCGGWNKDTFGWHLKKIPNNLEITKIRDSEGTQLYVLQGEKASLASIFDFYVNKFSSSKEEKEVWEELKNFSYQIEDVCHCPKVRVME